MWRQRIHPIAMLIQDLIEYIVCITDNRHSWDTYFIYNNQCYITSNIKNIIIDYNIDNKSIETNTDDWSKCYIEEEQDLIGFDAF